MSRLALAAIGAAALAATPVAAQTGRAIPEWRRGATCYEVFVRSFADADGDGVGDLKGLIRHLDYINDGNPRSTRSLGARCIWLMPVAESPSYHGYDVSNYYRVQPAYGTNADFRRLVAAAHHRGIRVLVDMVLNHSSDRNPWFLAALRDTASPYRSWYRFSPTLPDQKGPWGQEVWHRSPVRDEWYYGVFTAQMPDLNYESPRVRQEADRIARYWLDSMGVDGFRLDAVKYLVEQGNQLENTPGTHRVLHDYASYVHRERPGSFTVGEAWDSIGTVLTYYPDQLDAYFGFEASDALLHAVSTGNATRLLAPFLRMQASVPGTRWAPFQRNHDQTRTATALGGDVARARQAATLLLTLPGLPFVYYGEEIGMTGDKPDERLRTPMQWTAGTTGFTRGTPWEPLQGDTLTVNVAAESRDSTSLLSLYRTLIHLRARNAALGSGTLVPLTSSDSAVAAYVRRDGAHAVVVLANLGTAPVSGFTVASDTGAVAAGRYRPARLLGDAAAAPLTVGADGRIQGWIPVPTLAPMASYVFDLAPARGR